MVKDEKKIKRKTWNIEYDVARKLEITAVEKDMSQTDLVNIILKKGLKQMENQTELEIE